MKVYIGYDDREHLAAKVAAKSLAHVTHHKIQPEFLCAPKLADHGLLTRLLDHRGGQDYDFVSNAKSSTRFAISRFLTPIICQGGYALFVDCDVVFHVDPRELLLEVKAEHAVSVVKHDVAALGGPKQKMVNQEQSAYPRKNWSSVMLFNCDHPANRRLSLRDVNERPGRDLHAFYWLADSEIGALSPRWNWLVGLQPRPPMAAISHFTLGGPWLAGWPGAEHDDIWLEASR